MQRKQIQSQTEVFSLIPGQPYSPFVSHGSLAQTAVTTGTSQFLFFTAVCFIEFLIYIIYSCNIVIESIIYICILFSLNIQRNRPETFSQQPNRELGFPSNSFEAITHLGSQNFDPIEIETEKFQLIRLSVISCCIWQLRDCRNQQKRLCFFVLVLGYVKNTIQK